MVLLDVTMVSDTEVRDGSGGQKLIKLFTSLRIERADRLIQKGEAWVRQQQADKGELLLLTDRQRRQPITLGIESAHPLHNRVEL